MWKVTITNIAGIRSGESKLREGKNIIQGSNFQGKTSFIKAIQTVTGTTGWSGQVHPLTESCEEGVVRLEGKGTDSIETRLIRNNGKVIRDGETILEDEVDITCTRLFAFLDDDNPIRAAVRDDDSKALTDLMQQPLRLENIEAKIAALDEELTRVQKEIEKSKSAHSERISLEQEISSLEEKLEELNNEQARLEEMASQSEEQTRINEELSKKQTAIQMTEKDINRLSNHLKRLNERKDEVIDELGNIEDIDHPENKISINDLETNLQGVELQLQMISDVHRSNQQLLDELAILEELTEVKHSVGEHGDKVKCWICGQIAYINKIEKNLVDIQEIRKKLLNQKDELEIKLNSLKDRTKAFEQNQQRQASLKNEIQKLQVEIEESQQELDSAKERRGKLTTSVKTLKDKFKSEREDIDEELTNVKTQLGSVQQQIQYHRDRIGEIQRSVQDLDKLEKDEEALKKNIKSLRERRESKQRELMDRFDSSISEIIDRFAPGFENAYLERLTNEDGTLDTYNIRLSRQVGGSIRQSSIAQLSEAERELIGIVTALAGYHTFNVHDRVQFLLLDGISQLSAENLHALLDHLEEMTEVLITTAYPESGEFDGHVITPEQWEVVPLDHIS